MRILLANDTATKSHIGCQAVSNAHARMLGRMGHTVRHRYFTNELAPFARSTMAETVAALERDPHVMQQLDACDAVVVNGEGTLHHGRGVDLLALLTLAKRRGKAALLVNALFQEMDVDADALNDLDAFFVRDPMSEAYARDRGIRCARAPDSILEAGFSEVARTDFGGGVVVTDWHKSRDADVGVSSTRFLLNAADGERRRFFPLHAREARAHWASARAAVGTAELILTGRHHGIYLAMMAGVPFVALDSNSWKIRATTESLGLPVASTSDPAGLAGQIAAARSRAAAFREAGERLRETRPLPIFDVLGRGGADTDETREVDRLQRQVAGRAGALARDRAIMAKRRRAEATLRWRILCEREGLVRGTLQFAGPNLVN